MADEKLYVSNGAETATAPKEALEWSRKTQAKIVDLKFTDLLGSWQHMTLPLSAFDEDAFEEGLGFDGSSIRGWQGISESDMLLMPQADTAILDPFTEAPTISILCEIIDPITREPYAKDPRRLARRAEEYLRSTGIADTCYFGPESEFFVFDSVAYDMQVNRAHLRGRLGRGPLELGRARARLHRAARRRATSRRRRATRCTTCAARWCSCSRASASRASSTTTRSRPAASARSTCASGR